ncbi:hypothetical protein Aduo_006316 [Ancylostoma duodenale]
MSNCILILLTFTLPLTVDGQEVTLTTILMPSEASPTVNSEPPAENSATTTAGPSPKQEPTVPEPSQPVTLAPVPPLTTTLAPVPAVTTTVIILPPEAAPTTTAACTEKDASWLAWSEWSTCSDECGSCGVHMRTRTCLTMVAGCTCPGESTTIEYCNLEICRYPRTTCCYNLKVTSYNGRFACLENSTFNG